MSASRADGQPIFFQRCIQCRTQFAPADGSARTLCRRCYSDTAQRADWNERAERLLSSISPEFDEALAALPPKGGHRREA